MLKIKSSRINPRIDHDLDFKIKQVAAILGIRKADLARRALEAYVQPHLSKVKTPAVS
jgi:hypothetical protein